MKDATGDGAARAIAALSGLLGERLTTAEAQRTQHGRDMSRLPASLPDAVAFPEAEAEVQAILRACAAEGVPVIPYGAGSSLEGHVIPTRGGITLNLQRMDGILEVAPQDFLAVVQPGVTRKALNAHLRDQGLMFPVDPGADASLGGMASTRASGTTAVRYGTMRENVLALRVVTADGAVLRTGSRARKSSTGYDLTHLFLGAEGTLGVITELTLRLHPIPEAISAAICAFPDTRAAIETVIELIQFGIPVARAEFLDEIAIGAANAHSGLDLPVAPTLFLEFHGSPAGVAEQARLAEEVATGHGGAGFAWSAEAEARNRLWQARHDLFWAVKGLRPGAVPLTGDICVPISRLADAICDARADLDASSLSGSILGHVGDGNFHAVYLIHPDSPAEAAEAEDLAARAAERALAVGGTVSGEHGIGTGKLRYLRAEHGEPAVEAMHALKRALDPQGILNPGKLGQAG